MNIMTSLCFLASACWTQSTAADQPELLGQVKEICRLYLEGFGSPATQLAYHHRLNGPRGLAALADPREIAAGTVNGKPMPYGYGSGIQDVALENGQLLFALCDAWEATRDPELERIARWIFQGMKRVAEVSRTPGFVPRGPHPDGKSYYRNSSRDQHMGFVEGLWRYFRSPLSTDQDRRFIAAKLAAVARRMEANGWRITVEDGSATAHVGVTWLQHTGYGAVTLLPFLAMVHNASGEEHWAALYRQCGEEKDSGRWRCLSRDGLDRWQAFTLYSNQFAESAAALERIETDPARRQILRDLLRCRAERALQSNVFDERDWRRLDWAGERGVAETEALLRPLGLSLGRAATVDDLYRAFDPRHWQTSSSELRTASGKLCFGLPTVAYHLALLSRDPALVRRATPQVRDMLGKMLDQGRHYEGGEDFNRTVILGLLLLAESKRSPISPAQSPVQ